jgi:hypothetical protein
MAGDRRRLLRSRAGPGAGGPARAGNLCGAPGPGVAAWWPFAHHEQFSFRIRSPWCMRRPREGVTAWDRPRASVMGRGQPPATIRQTRDGLRAVKPRCAQWYQRILGDCTHHQGAQHEQAALPEAVLKHEG